MRLLLPVSGPLGEIGGLLEEAFESGHANVAAVLIEQEPRLIDGMDLSRCHAAALENNHGNLASCLSSLIEKRELSAMAANAPRQSLATTRL